ncbi:BAD_collapsed_G0006380.mRNA.1.CDS.1 [Saccharomyces cerevisiae]|nr:hypothetical protein H812_YJM1401C00150 [Saccharomyces cerevisiae YJM1401]AJQ34615.1 hypothetical protein H820_YJM1439C00149 [Saccharomyces cerevisiae YJM1439]AJQ39857.1 hypothetical protein H788_YJM1248C00149 [Saccharomyces cerevisiae YJM1248]CAI4309608.1 AKH_1a_G0006220.mRNA.1.CDS.1 [Saccharomyces cerevisiae]CAI6524801.1 AKH_1a_G0006220.mRNA.1.CDS.1 [Saccharomyces cerevisiae]
MVTFNCEVCNDTVPKKNTEKHYYRCPNAYYTCIDCSKTFEDGVSYKNHTSCISEDEKYQKALYKGNKKQKQKQQQKQQQQQPVATPAKKVEKPVIKKAEKVEKTSNGIELHKGKSLYKILKTMKDKGAKKTFLKSLVVDSEGQIRYAKE